VLAECHALAQSINAKAAAQYEYSVEENIPRGILKEDEVGDHAIQHGIVTALTARAEWEIPVLLELCADIMEDVNDHETAAELRAKAAVAI